MINLISFKYLKLGTYFNFEGVRYEKVSWVAAKIVDEQSTQKGFFLGFQPSQKVSI